MALTIELLKQQIASLRPSVDADMALTFLEQSDLRQIIPAGENYSPAGDWLRVYKIRHASTLSANATTHGFPSLLAALEKMHPSVPLTIATADTKEWFGAFWSDQADRLVGFVLVKRRSPQQEQERLDWFRENLT